MLCIDVSFPLREYSGRNMQGKIEYIPSPSRVVCAFLATSCQDSRFIEAVKKLEDQFPKILVDSDNVVKGRNIPPFYGYKFSKSGVDPKFYISGAHSSGRVKPLLTRDSSVVFSGNPTVSYFYDIQDSDTIAGILKAQSGKIGYLGCSQDAVVVNVSSIDSLPCDGRKLFSPVPNKHGFVTVAGQGFVDFLQEKYDSGMDTNFTDPSRVHNIGYIPLKKRQDGRDFYILSVKSQKDKWSKKFKNLQQSMGVEDLLIPLVGPSRNLYGLVYENKNNDPAEFMENTLKYFYDFEEFDYNIERYVGASHVWKTYTPALLPREEHIAKAMAMSDISSQTGLDFNDIFVEISPLREQDKTHSSPGSHSHVYAKWSVICTTSVPINGPLAVGKETLQGFGRLKHVKE